MLDVKFVLETCIYYPGVTIGQSGKHWNDPEVNNGK